MSEKRGLGITVLDAARQRIAWVFDTFPRIYVSFSGGKDSTVMLHLVMDEAIRRNRKVGVLFVDLEGQYKLTIEHIQHCYDLYADLIEPFWCCLPIALRNAVSVFEPKWCAWEPGREADWIRQPPPMAITDHKHFPFFRYHAAGQFYAARVMEFEEFVPAFGDWYSQGKLTACFVGIRTSESLNRWRTIAGHGTKFEGRNWTNYVMKTLWNVYPIYDWSTEDIWVYHGKTNKPYNRLYDRMHQAGLTLHQMRICQPYGDDQRKGLWLFHIIEPETWSRIVARVNGANQGALYAQENGNILGRIKIDKPEGHTWESFAILLLESMPPTMAEHYKNKIAVFIKWYRDAGYPDGIPDEVDYELERNKEAPSWRRICKTLLRNDYWCKGIGFSMQAGTAHARYQQLMAKRRNTWNIFPLQD
jgi:predicted phosphoadenosine phosphosulfate sulfurtransferase